MADSVREEVALQTSRDVSGGVNNFLFSGNIGENQSVAQKNMNIEKPGTRRKRDGYISIANDTGDADKMRIFNFNPDAIAERLIGYTADQLYEWTGTGSWVSIGTALGTDGKMDAFQADNEIYFLLDGSNVQSWDGSTLTDEGATASDPPQGSTGLYKFGRAFISGVSANPNLVYYSNQSTGAGLGAGAWLTTQNVAIKGIGSGDRIVAIVPFRRADILVFTEKSIWNIDITDSTPSNWVVTEVHPKLGCGARDTVRVVGNDVIFMDQNGNFRTLLRTVEDLNAGVDAIPLSQGIQGHIDTFSAPNLANASATSFGRLYFVAVTLSASENDALFIYDTVTKAWTGPWTGWLATNYAVSTVEGGKEKLYFGNAGSTSEAFYYAIDTFTDDGTAIEMVETSKKYDFGDNRIDKMFQSIEIIAESTGNSDIKVECQIDDQGFITVGTMNLTGGGVTLPVDYPFTLGATGFTTKIFPLDALLGAGRFIQWRLTHDDSGEECRIISVQVSAYIENINYGGPAQ